MDNYNEIDFNRILSNPEEVRLALKNAKLYIIDEDDVQPIRERLEKQNDGITFVAQAGGQNNMLMSHADITIGGGSRGGTKSFSLLMNALYDITNPHFNAIILRKNLNDMKNMERDSAKLYKDYGSYNKSKNDMTWNYSRGGQLTFSYHDDPYNEFHDRFQGQQFSYIGIDEITQMDYRKFKYIATTNRNADGIRNRIFGTCNPDPDSWVAKFIDWWIGDDGLPIHERDSVVRYCFMDGDYIEDVVWGDTREEVFEKCKYKIMRHWKPQFNRYGNPQDLFISSVCFTEARIDENVMLMSQSPDYIAKLGNMSEEEKARDLDGNWKFKSVGDDVIKLADMDKFYKNPEQRGDNQRYITCDVAFDGGDQCVFIFWIGNHIDDIYTCKKDAKTTVEIAKALLDRWKVREENFAYDLLGIGHTFKGFFPKALPFNAREAVDEKVKGMYYCINAQAAYLFADHVKDGTYSINPILLERRYTGKNYKNMLLREILNQERRCIRFREDDPRRLIDKAVEMKRLIGRSPDFVDAMKMKEIFNIKHVHHKPKNLGLITGAPKHIQQRYRTMFNSGWW